MLFIPIVLMLLFGFAISTEVNNVRVAAVAPVRSETIYNKVSAIDANPYFSFKGLSMMLMNIYVRVRSMRY